MLAREIGDATDAVEQFLGEQCIKPVAEMTQWERTNVLELMELGRQAQLMYTSCGWFFDEISGIETVQIIAYAGRVFAAGVRAFLAKRAPRSSRVFLEILAEAKPNVADLTDGSDIYTRYVGGMRIGLEQVGAHYAISSVFRNYPEEGELFLL